MAAQEFWHLCQGTMHTFTMYTIITPAVTVQGICFKFVISLVLSHIHGDTKLLGIASWPYKDIYTARLSVFTGY